MPPVICFRLGSALFKLVELPIMVRKGLKERHLRFENQYLRKQLDEKYGFSNIIGVGVATNALTMKPGACGEPKRRSTTSTRLAFGGSGAGNERQYGIWENRRNSWNSSVCRAASVSPEQ